MRDYAEIGRTVLRGGRGRAGRRAGRQSRLDGIWQAVASPSTTVALELLLVALLVLEASSAGNPLPEAHASRLGPTALRIVLVLLGVQLTVSFLQRLLPWALTRRAHVSELELESSLEVRKPLPELEDDPDLTAILKDSGAGVTRALGRRRAFALSGRWTLWGVPLFHLGVGVTLAGFVWTLEQPRAARLVLAPGETQEVLEGSGGASVFTGARFQLLAPEGLGSLAGEDGAKVQLAVQDFTNNEKRTLELKPDRNVGLADGRQLRLRSIRQAPEAGSAKLRVTGSAEGTQEVYPGGAVEVGGKSFTVVGMTLNYKRSMGPAVKLSDGAGGAFWLFAGEAALSRSLGAPEGLELLGVAPRYEVVFEYFEPRDGTLFMVGMLLMLLGGVVLLSRGQLAVEVLDEVDRVVVRGSSINDATGVSRGLEHVRTRVESALKLEASSSSSEDAPSAEEVDA